MGMTFKSNVTDLSQDLMSPEMHQALLNIIKQDAINQ
jgi:hypothetical protein